MSATAIPQRPTQHPIVPGPRGLPGSAPLSWPAAIPRNPKPLARDYGDIVYYHFLDFHFYLLFHPQHVEQFCSVRPATSLRA